MMKNIIKIGALSLLLGAVSCSNDDSINEKSVLPSGLEGTNSTLDNYLYDTFTDKYNIKVLYKWDRSQFGKSKDILRNLYPPVEANVMPAMEMVDHVWIKTYEKVAGEQFIHDIRPLEFILAGGSAWNDDKTRTLGVATSGVRISLFEVDLVGKSPASAREFIHTIQHEYIHIINQDKEFVEKDFGAETLGDYTTNWQRVSPTDALEKGFVTPYATNNIFEDFAETASYMLTHTKEEYEAMLESFKIANSNNYRPGRAKIMNKVQFVRDYFKDHFGVNFDDLALEANKNAASSPLLNPGASGINAISNTSPYGVQKDGTVRYCEHDMFWKNKSDNLNLNK